MNTLAGTVGASGAHPVDIDIPPAVQGRNRLTVAFRMILALPHLLLVGGPVAAIMTWSWSVETGLSYDIGAGGGVLGAVAGVAAMIGWFWILLTGKFPDGLRSLATFYLRWRVRAVSYVALLRDEYPPFGDAVYPTTVELPPAPAHRDRLTVAFRIILAIPHLLAVWVLGIAWFFSTVIAWFAILFTGSFPEGLYRFGVGVLRWNTRVEAYLLLLHDEYPPFSLT
jgi:hypothetical protein